MICCIERGGTLEGSSQESLTYAAANLEFCESDDEIVDEDLQTENLTTGGLQVLSNIIHQSPGIIERRKSLTTQSKSSSGNDASCFPTRASNVVANDLSVIDRIEKIFKGIFDALLCGGKEVGITLKLRPTTPVHRSKMMDSVKLRRIRFPGMSPGEAWQFTVVLRILELIYEALRDEKIVSKRDIYYRDPALFGNQTHVNRYVDDIAFTFGVPRSALNVTAVSKGLVVGAVTFLRRDGAVLRVNSDREGFLVPNIKEIVSADMSSVRWIIVIEKEASFRSIAASDVWESICTHGVLITGKGYPDIATRALIHFLATPSPQNGFASPPVYGLADFDPDGLAILSIYKHGSIALAHENASLMVGNMEWLGLRSNHVLMGAVDAHASQGLLTLTGRDRTRGLKMLEHHITREKSDDNELYCVELQTMLMLNVKAELQLLDAISDGMTSLLESALQSR